MKGGTYCIVMKLDRPTHIKVGRLGCGFFPQGYYVYVGSAMNGLKQRIARHLSPLKKKHWHIDYLLDHTQIVATRTRESSDRRECFLSEEVRNISQDSPMKGFGSSDCRCKTHLSFFAENPVANPRFERIWQR